MGTTIGNILISYDIDRLHTQVKTALEALSYSDKFRNAGNPKTYNLPNTTLWHESKSSDQAISDLKIICTRLNVVLEKAVTIKASEFVGI